MLQGYRELPPWQMNLQWQPRSLEPVSMIGPLKDGFGRVHTDLRISVTDRCNIRCFYCMPAENVKFRPQREILTFEEITRFVRIVAPMGIDKLRLTGGEPLVRRDLWKLIEQLARVANIRDIALTTNGLLLAQQADALRRAGLRRLNVSLDTLDPKKFTEITRREGFDRVIEGIMAAKQAGFEKIKINAIAIRGLTEDEVVPLGRFGREHGFEVRFIEFMPLDADDAWQSEQVLTGGEIKRILEEGIGPLEAVPPDNPAQPSTDYRFVDGEGRIGLINPVSEPFCEACNRLRLTAEGKVRNCLFSTEEWDARALLRGKSSDDEIADLVRASVGAKKEAHGINTEGFVKPERAMYQIGG